MLKNPKNALKDWNY